MKNREKRNDVVGREVTLTVKVVNLIPRHGRYLHLNNVFVFVGILNEPPEALKVVCPVCFRYLIAMVNHDRENYSKACSRAA